MVSVVMRPLIHSKARCCAKQKYEQSLAFTIHIPEVPYADPLQATRVLAKTAQIAAFGPAGGGHARAILPSLPDVAAHLEAISALECERATSARVASPRCVDGLRACGRARVDALLWEERWGGNLGLRPTDP